MSQIEDSLFELVSQTSSNLPEDVRRALRDAATREDPSSRAGKALGVIAHNIDIAHDRVLPICQDTGLPTFHVRCPVGFDQMAFAAATRGAIARATAAGRLRPNSVDSLTGRNSGDNLGPGTPSIHFEQWSEPDVEVKLLLKGGGCENMNAQYALPTDLPGLGRAGRDLDGVRKCVLHAVQAAQGQGCSVGFLGVCVGSDRAGGYIWAKEQLFHDVAEPNPAPELAELEDQIVREANTLEIGPMGFGGRRTVVGCRIGVLNRIPASFFVSIAYNCWAYRRLGIRLDPTTGDITRWLFRADAPEPMSASDRVDAAASAIPLETPLAEDDVRRLRVGDMVKITGVIYTGRDALHKHLMTADSPVDLRGAALFHCGPVMVRSESGGWAVKGAGPTTSSREEPYQATVLRKFGIRAVIGKGGMGAETLAALGEVGAVYLNAVGGAAQVYSDAVEAVEGVEFLEDFGVPEAMWKLRVRDFVAVVTMDSAGGSLHREVEELSAARLASLGG